MPALADLTAQAYARRPATQQTAYAQQNLAVPKLLVGLDYASYGNTYNNYVGLQSAIDLPVLNRDQGALFGVAT